MKHPQRPSRQPQCGLGLLVVLAALVLGIVSYVWPARNRLPDEYAVYSREGRIYTVDESHPTVECILIRGSRIQGVGTLSEIQARSVERLGSVFNTLKFLTGLGELSVFRVNPGSIVVPGLADAHAHILEYGFSMQLRLDGAKSVDDVVDRVKHYINTHPDVYNNMSRWIEGTGWDQTTWPGGQFPTAADLDKDPLLHGRPISLSRIDYHASWVSTRVLELMGPLPSVVEGGVIERDSEGRPSGVFVDNAMNLIPKPSWSETQMLNYFHMTMRDALEHGLTSIHDAEASPAAIDLFRGMADAGKLPLRIYAMSHVSSPDYEHRLPRFINHGTHSRLNVRGVKLFTDGALGSWGAALLQPYSDNPSTTGLLLHDPKKLEELVKRLWRDGQQVNIHCIGDRANQVALDIFENILDGERDPLGRKVDVSQWRPRIEHAQIMTKEDLIRTGKLGVIASVQPTHATSDMWYAESRLGDERIKGAYAYQTLLQASPNHVLPLGSDFPVEGINPLFGFYAAVSRLSIAGTSPHGPGGWFPDERLTRTQALKGMTLDAAYASFAEDDIGSLVPGKKADFVVLDRDIMDVPTGEVLETKVLATVVDGRVEYGVL